MTTEYAIIYAAVMLSIATFALGVILDSLSKAVSRIDHNYRKQIEAEYIQSVLLLGSGDVVMCAGCARSIPTLDGFSPIEHNCSTLDNKA